MLLANSFYKHEDIHRYAWRRGIELGTEQKFVVDYIIILMKE